MKAVNADNEYLRSQTKLSVVQDEDELNVPCSDVGCMGIPNFHDRWATDGETTLFIDMCVAGMTVYNSSSQLQSLRLACGTVAYRK